MQACGTTRECPRDEFCENGAACVSDACRGFNDCGALHECRTPRSGQLPGPVTGACSLDCVTNVDCRPAYRCKAFEDFSKSCAVAGAGQVGERCSTYRDCANDMICLGVPGGYCASAGCDPGDCGPNALCADGAGIEACFKRCQNDGDCRAAEGYGCRVVPGGQVCLPN